MIQKTILRSDECYIQFTDEELAKLNIKKGDKFTWEINNDSSVTLKKCVPVEIDLSDFTKEQLIYLIELSIEENISVEDVIVQILEQYISKSE